MITLGGTKQGAPVGTAYDDDIKVHNCSQKRGEGVVSLGGAWGCSGKVTTQEAARSEARAW